MKTLYYYFCFFLLLFISSCTDNKQPSEGILDLTNIPNAGIEAHTLTGEWEFYWNQLLTPTDFEQNKSLKPQFVSVPASWTSYTDNEGNNYPSDGFATYRLTILLPQQQENIGLYIPKVWSSSKVWINGRLIAEVGKVTDNKEGFGNMVLEKLVSADILSGKIELIVQVTSYDFFIAGLIRDFKFGEYQHLNIKKKFENTWSLMWLGSVFLMAIYHFILYYFRKKSSSTLFFAFICLMMAFRTVVFGEHFIYEYIKEYGWLTFGMQSRIYYITTFMLVPVGLLYAESLYPQEAKKKFIKISLIASTVYSLFLIVVPTSFFSLTILPAQIIPIISGVYLVYILAMAVVRKRRESSIQITGIAIMVLAGINDALHSQGIEIFGDDELLPAALGVFLAIQFLIIAKRFSYAFNKAEDLTINLEKKVVERTTEISNKNEEIEAQKEAIEKKSEQLGNAFTQITDSVKYARRIQKAIMGNKETIKEYFSDAFLLFQPRNIVSGDFYWYSEQQDKRILIAGDCTGHGVPGAFMTVMGSNFLNEIINNNKVLKPCEILYHLDQKVTQTLIKKEDSEYSTNDGMDMSVVFIDKNEQKVIFSGAKNPLYIIRKDQNNKPKVHQIKGNKFPIGGASLGKQKEFDSHEITYHKDDVFYMFTDGYQDQFGGSENRKFMRKRFRELLLEISQLPMYKQKEILKKTIADWRNGAKQTDDILVIGFRV